QDIHNYYHGYGYHFDYDDEKKRKRNNVFVLYIPENK
ncbi:MAG: hypothetical protein QG657_3770, partial [Acidobacteriota bacterium]|nr:hypothetical protein [Acidobacteriota bacterium]